MNPHTRIALFIDFDNAQIAAMEMRLTHCWSSQLWVSPLVREVEQVVGGRVDIRRCYGNTLLNAGQVFSDKVFHPHELRDRIAVDVDLQMDLLNNGFQMIHTPKASGKNRADILMALDCMEIATKYEQIDTFAILSHDSDFSPLIHRLRALGKDVAWVTVGEISPVVKGKRSMESMATQRVIFDQRVVDQAGYDIFTEVIRELQNDAAKPLVAGVPLTTLLARMHQRDADFSYEDLGFRKFREFVEASVEAPLELLANAVRLKTTKPSAPNVPPPLAAKPAAAVQNGVANAPAPEGEREREISSCLSRLSLRPLPTLRKKVTAWLYTDVFDESGKPRTDGLTHAALEAQIEARFHPQEAGKNQLREVTKLYGLAGVLVLERAEQQPLRDARVVRFEQPDMLRSELAALFIQRLQSKGLAIGAGDIERLAAILFENTEPPYLEAVRQGVEKARQRDDTNPAGTPDTATA